MTDEREGVKGMALDLLDEMNQAGSIHHSDYSRLQTLIWEMTDPGVAATKRKHEPSDPRGTHG